MIIQSNRNLPVKNQHPFRSPEGKGLLDIKDRFEPDHSTIISEAPVFTMKEKYNIGKDTNKVCKKQTSVGDTTGFITGGIAAVFGLLTLGAAIAMALAMFVGSGGVIALGL